MKLEDISFENVDGRDLAFIRITGNIDLQFVDWSTQDIKNLFPRDFEGNIVFDLRDTIDALANEDFDEVISILSTARYFFRRPVAVLVPEAAIQRSRKLYQSAFERVGMLARDFTNLDDALRWFDDPDA